MTSARDLSARLADLLRRERAALSEFLLALADFDERRLWLQLGHASLFYFLHRELGLSKGAAFYRKTAAELIRRFPEVVEPLRDGRLCLTSVVELAKVLTPENRGDVLPRFFHLSKREAQAVSAALRPDEAAPHREVVTAVRAPIAPGALALASVERCVERQSGRAETSALSFGSSPGPAALTPMFPVHAVTPVPDPDRATTASRPEPLYFRPSVHPDEPRGASADPCPAPTAPPSTTQPLTADLSRLHVTVSRRFLDKLEAARAALSHSHPGASAQEILEAGLDLLIERQVKRRGLVEKPRRAPPPAKPAHMPAHVKRAVWERDGGRCQWELASGGICGSIHRVEIDHIVPRGRGGSTTIENTRLLCRVHNDLAARRVYGDAWMDRYTPRAGRSASAAMQAASAPWAPVPTGDDAPR